MPVTSKLRPLAAPALLLAVLGVGHFLKLDPSRHVDAALRPYVADQDGVLYPFTRDSFLYLRQGENAAEHGHAGEHLEAGEPWDALSSPPRGRPAPPGLLARLLALGAAVSGASLAAVAHHLPAVLGTLALVFVFLLGWDLGGSALRGGAAGLAAAFLAAVHPELVSNCHAGIVDTTALNLLLFSAGSWLFLRAFEALRHGAFRPAGLYGAGALGVIVLFRLAWAGWAALAGLALGALAVHLWLAVLFRAGSPGRKLLVAVGGLALGGLAATAAATSTLGTRLVSYSGAEGHSLFPTGLGQVQELAGLSAGLLVERLGGWPLVLLALAGAVLGLGLREGREVRTLFLLAWLVPAAAAGFFSMRFAVYAVPPLAVLAGGGLALGAAKLFARRSKKALGLPPKRAVLAAACAVAVLAALAWSFRDRLEGFRGRRPSADRAMAEAAEAIRTRSAEDAVINAWWDEGYVYSHLAERAVALDGGSLGQPRLYWLARALTTADETEALRLLRWIDCGALEAAFDALARDTEKRRAARLLQGAARHPAGSSAAAYFATEGVSAGAAARAAEILDCGQPEAWVVVSSELLGKTTGWAFYGTWNLGGVNPPLVQPKVTAEALCEHRPGGFSCTNGVEVDIREDGWTDRSSPGHLAAHGPVRPDGWVSVVYQVRRNLAQLYVREDLLDSLFARLYFFHGRDLEHFRLAHDAGFPPYTRRVLAYRIDW